MIDRSILQKTVKSYDNDNISIAALGSHSALDIMDGATSENLNTIVICQKGREVTYKHFHRIINNVITLPKFSDLLNDDVQKSLISNNSIMIPHRSFTTYIDYDSIENNLQVPIFGNRGMLRTEERNVEKNQYYLLKKANIRYPKLFNKPEDIDRLVIVKVMESTRKIERAFFTASSFKEFNEKAEKRIAQGIINAEDLADARIEEFILGTYFNFNFFYSILHDRVEFLGIDRRLQTNLNDFTSLPAKQQLEIDVELQTIEVGHMPATIRESFLEKVFEMGNKFVDSTKKEFDPGLIGPFALQSAVTKDFELVVFDVSPRVPGSPVLMMSPYTHYYYGESFGTGKRIAMEISEAIKEERLDEVVT